MTSRLWVIALGACGMIAGCGGQPEVDTVTQEASALESTGLPTGFTCGLAYRRPGSPIYGNDDCQGFAAIRSTFPEGGICAVEDIPPAPPGFTVAGDGDRGLPACNGFYHFRFSNFNAVASTQYRLPRGTACGFKEACNDSGERCMGFDANVSCPAGWTRKVASDLNAPSGCGFVWCEYQDPNNLCTTTDCQVTNQPVGLICGITDNDRNNGQCLGQLTTTGCPAGYNRYGYFDDGRSAGHGVGWCARFRPIIVP